LPSFKRLVPKKSRAPSGVLLVKNGVSHFNELPFRKITTERLDKSDDEGSDFFAFLFYEDPNTITQSQAFIGSFFSSISKGSGFDSERMVSSETAISISPVGNFRIRQAFRSKHEPILSPGGQTRF
jgi:hypothetical protein